MAVNAGAMRFDERKRGCRGARDRGVLGGLLARVRLAPIRERKVFLPEKSFNFFCLPSDRIEIRKRDRFDLKVCLD